MHACKEFGTGMCPLVTIQCVSGQETGFDFVEDVFEVCDEGRFVITPFSGGTGWEVGGREGVVDVEMVVRLDEILEQHRLEDVRFEAGLGKG